MAASPFSASNPCATQSVAVAILNKEREAFPFPLPLFKRTATIPTTVEVMTRCQNERCRLQPITKPGEVITRTSL